MVSVWGKLFANRPAPANDAGQSPYRDDARSETARRGEATPKSQKVARIFAAIACQFSPFSFFPDRNDRLQIQVTTELGQSCTMAFKKAWL